MHTQQITDLEAMLEGDVQCQSEHSPEWPCSVEAVAYGRRSCDGASMFVCHMVLEYWWRVFDDKNTCIHCNHLAEDCWHYRLI